MLYLYNLTLQQATSIVCAVNDNFVGSKSQEIAVARGKTFDLLRPDDAGKIQTLHSIEVFGAICSLYSPTVAPTDEQWRLECLPPLQALPSYRPILIIPPNTSRISLSPAPSFTSPVSRRRSSSNSDSTASAIRNG